MGNEVQDDSEELSIESFAESLGKSREHDDPEENQESQSADSVEEEEDQEAVGEKADESDDPEKESDEMFLTYKDDKTGEDIKVKPEEALNAWKKQGEMQKYFTQRTQRDAEQERQRQETFGRQMEALQAYQDDIANYKAIEDQLKSFDGLNWNELFAADPAQAGALSMQYNQLQRRHQELGGSLGQKFQDLDQSIQARRAEAHNAIDRYMLDTVGEDWNPQNIEKMLNAGNKYGFSPAEIKAGLTDKRTAHMFFELVTTKEKYDALMAKKPEALKKLKEAPPIVKKQGTSKKVGDDVQRKMEKVKRGDFGAFAELLSATRQSKRN